MEENYDFVVCKPDAKGTTTNKVEELENKIEELENKIECLEAKNDFFSECLFKTKHEIQHNYFELDSRISRIALIGGIISLVYGIILVLVATK